MSVNYAASFGECLTGDGGEAFRKKINAKKAHKDIESIHGYLLFLVKVLFIGMYFTLFKGKCGKLYGMEVTPEMQKIMNDMIAEQQARAEAGRKKAEKARESTPPLNQGELGGKVSLGGKSLDQAVINLPETEGEEFLGRNPEEVVLGDKRRDWYQKKQ